MDPAAPDWYMHTDGGIRTMRKRGTTKAVRSALSQPVHPAAEPVPRGPARGRPSAAGGPDDYSPGHEPSTDKRSLQGSNLQPSAPQAMTAGRAKSRETHWPQGIT